MRTPGQVRVGMLVLGLCLIALAGWLWPAPTLSAGDVQVALGDMKRVSLDRARPEQSFDLDLTVPDTEAWTRIRKAWGDPGYLIAVVADGRSYVLCFDRMGLTARATVGGEVLPLSSANRAPYGYSEECQSAGLSFHAAPGAVVRVHVGGSPDPDRRVASLVIKPFWTSGVKDRLVGYDLAKQLRPPLIFVAILGLFLAGYSMLGGASPAGASFVPRV